MADAVTPTGRCGIDTVAIERIERLLAQTPPGDLQRIFSPQELADAGTGPGRAARLAARFAAKEACVKLFPREAALGGIEPEDFSVVSDGYGAPQVECGPRAAELLGLHRIASISLSLTHDHSSASAVALAVHATASAPLAGRVLYHVFPFRRDVVLANLKRVYAATLPETEIIALAQAHYGHLWRLAGEFLRFRWMSTQRRAAQVRVEGIETLVAALAQGKGVLVVTGHFGNWEVATVAGVASHPEVRGRFHFVRRAIKPAWLDALVTRGFEKGGFGVIGKRGSLDRILELLAAGNVVVFPFDQHAAPPDGIEVDFFGHPAWTFKSLAIIALATGAPVLPGTSWRRPDGRHVLHFGEPLPRIECDDTNEAIRRNTRVYNAALERQILARPEQWYWVHRRWKAVAPRSRKGRTARA